MSARPDRAAGGHRRAARGLRGDGRRADPLGALGEHQGAPRRLHRAVRRRRRDGHAGRAHPRPPRRDAGRGRRRARRATTRRARSWILNDPFRGGTHLPDITVITPVVRATASCSASPPAAPTTPTSAGATPGSMPADRRTLEEEGVVIAPRVLDDDGDRASSPAQMRQPAPAPRRPARAARRQPRRRACACAELAERVGRDALREAMAEPCSTTPSGARAPAWRSSTDGERAAADVLEARRGRPRAAAARDRRRRAADARLRRQRRPARRQPQLPARRHALGLLLRRARADRPRHPAERRRLPPDRGARARGLAAQRAPARRRGGRQRRDLLARRRPRARRVRPRARPGHDEQPHARQRATSPTTRRSAAARARARTPTARAACTSR